MEQNEKVFDRLNNKFIELQNEFINLSNEKTKMETELKSELQKANDTIYQLENEMSNLTQKLQEKSSINKKLQKENTNLKSQLNEAISENKVIYDDKKNLEIGIQNLKDEKKQNKKEIEILLNQNRILENEIKSKNKKQIDNKTIIYYEKQLNESNNTIKRMGEMIKELENQIEELQKEIETHSNMNKEEEIKNYITQLELLSEEKIKELKEKNPPLVFVEIVKKLLLLQTQKKN